MKKLTLFLILLLCACGTKSPPYYSILPSENGTEKVFLNRMPIKRTYSVQVEPNEYVDGAIAFWNLNGLNGLLGYNNGGFPIEIQVVPTSESLPITAFNGSQADGVAYSYPSRCLIKIRESSLAFSNYALLAHELGHCIGFDHSTNRRSIMYPSVGISNQITSEIVRLVEANRSPVENTKRRGMFLEQSEDVIIIH